MRRKWMSCSSRSVVLTPPVSPIGTRSHYKALDRYSPSAVSAIFESFSAPGGSSRVWTRYHAGPQRRRVWGRFERPLPAGVREAIMGGILVIGIGLLLLIVLIFFSVVDVLAAIV